MAKAEKALTAKAEKTVTAKIEKAVTAKAEKAVKTDKARKKENPLANLSLAELRKKQNEVAKSLLTFRMSMDSSLLEGYTHPDAARRELKKLNRQTAITLSQRKNAK